MIIFLILALGSVSRFFFFGCTTEGCVIIRITGGGGVVYRKTITMKSLFLLCHKEPAPRLMYLNLHWKCIKIIIFFQQFRYVSDFYFILNAQREAIMMKFILLLSFETLHICTHHSHRCAENIHSDISKIWKSIIPFLYIHFFLNIYFFYSIHQHWVRILPYPFIPSILNLHICIRSSKEKKKKNTFFH